MNDHRDPSAWQAEIDSVIEAKHVAGMSERFYLEEAARRGHTAPLLEREREDIRRVNTVAGRAIIADDLRELSGSDIGDVYRIASRWDGTNHAVSSAIAAFDETVTRPDRDTRLPSTTIAADKFRSSTAPTPGHTEDPFLAKLGAFEHTWQEHMGDRETTVSLWEPFVDAARPSVGVARTGDGAGVDMVRITLDPIRDKVELTTRDGQPIDLARASRMLDRPAPETRQIVDAAAEGLHSSVTATPGIASPRAAQPVVAPGHRTHIRSSPAEKRARPAHYDARSRTIAIPAAASGDRTQTRARASPDRAAPRSRRGALPPRPSPKQQSEPERFFRSGRWSRERELESKG